MKIVKNLFEGLKKARPLRPVKPVIETLEGILLGSPETTAGAPHFLDHIEIKRYMSTVIVAMIPTTVAAAVFFGKEVFGGTGRNIFNPALVGRIFITIAFPEIMSAAWQAPFSDAITAATPLAVYRSAQGAAPYLDLLLGQVAGSTGEVFRIGIIAPPLFQLLSGGLLFGAVFMATDPVSSPATKPGKLIFGALCGIITVLIRTFSGFTEGVMFSIVFMNAFSPLIDSTIVNLKYRPAE